MIMTRIYFKITYVYLGVTCVTFSEMLGVKDTEA